MILKQCTKGFVQRRMRSRLDSLVEVKTKNKNPLDYKHHVIDSVAICRLWSVRTRKKMKTNIFRKLKVFLWTNGQTVDLWLIITGCLTFDVVRTRVKKLIKFTRCTVVMRRWNLKKKIKRIRSRIRIHGFKRFQRRWLKLPSFSSVMRYQKLDKFWTKQKQTHAQCI